MTAAVEAQKKTHGITVHDRILSVEFSSRNTSGTGQNSDEGKKKIKQSTSSVGGKRGKAAEREAHRLGDSKDSGRWTRRESNTNRISSHISQRGNGYGEFGRGLPHSEYPALYQPYAPHPSSAAPYYTGYNDPYLVGSQGLSSPYDYGGGTIPLRENSSPPDTWNNPYDRGNVASRSRSILAESQDRGDWQRYSNRSGPAAAFHSQKRSDVYFPNNNSPKGRPTGFRGV